MKRKFEVPQLDKMCSLAWTHEPESLLYYMNKEISKISLSAPGFRSNVYTCVFEGLDHRHIKLEFLFLSVSISSLVPNFGAIYLAGAFSIPEFVCVILNDFK